MSECEAQTVDLWTHVFSIIKAKLLTICENLFWWLPGQSLTQSLTQSQFFKLQTLSNMTKLILLDSLLQEVCINSGLTMKMCIAA